MDEQFDGILLLKSSTKPLGVHLEKKSKNVQVKYLGVSAEQIYCEASWPWPKSDADLHFAEDKRRKRCRSRWRSRKQRNDTKKFIKTCS